MELEEKIYLETRKNSPSSIAIDITSKCNFKCLHCFNESGEVKNDDLSDEQLLNAFEQMKDMGLITVCLCGGEPMMRYDLAKKALKILKGHVGQVNMVSNGWFATKENLQELKSLGLHSYQVSLDGKNAFQHDNFRNKPGAFDRAINAIKMAKQVGLTVSTATTPNKFNYKSISEIIDLCYSLGVSLMRSMPLIPMGRGHINQNIMLSADEYIYYQFKMKQAVYKYQYLMSIEWGDPIDHLFRMPINAQANLKTFHVDIKSNGNIVPSTYLPIVVGNIKETTLKEFWEKGFKYIWKNKKLLDLISEIEDVNDIGAFYEKRNNEEIRLEMNDEI